MNNPVFHIISCIIQIKALPLQRKSELFTSQYDLIMKSPVWIWQYDQWPHFCWNDSNIISLLARIREQQGQLIGLMNGLGFDTQHRNALEVMTEDVLRNAEIEGMLLNPNHVRSSVARHLGLDTAGMPEADHYTEGVVQVLMDAVQHASSPLTAERLFNWHAALFRTGRRKLLHHSG